MNREYFKFIFGFMGIIAFSALVILATHYIDSQNGFAKTQDATVIQSE